MCKDMQKNSTDVCLTPLTKTNWEVQDLNIKTETIKLIKNIGEKLLDKIVAYCFCVCVCV